MMFTKEEYNSKINELIEVCNWCKRVKLTCEECVNVYGRCIRNKGILTLAEELTKNEHFDNPPLKFEELEEKMWVWENYYKTPALIYKPDENVDYFEYTCWDWSKGGVIRNDDDLKYFYRYEVKE